MKKILVIGLSPILGGVETYIYNLTRFMDKNRYSFDYLIIGDKKSVFEDEINNIFNDKKNHFFYCPNLKKHYLKGKLWLKNFSKTHKYDYIYLNTCTSAKYQYCSIFIKNGAKLISHSHSGSGYSEFNNAFFRPALRKNSFCKLSCSDVAGKWLYGKNCTDFIIIPNGVDVNRFEFNQKDRCKFRNNNNISDDDILIGHVGRFNVAKNHIFLINLSVLLPNNYKFLFIGNGETKKDILKKIDELNYNDRFIILDAKSDIEKYYSAMDVFIMPSLYEGLPIASVEAQANGLHCIFSDTVSKQSDLSNHCVFYSLNDVDKWVEHIKSSSFNRYDGKKEICERKFDIKSTVMYFENIINSDNEEINNYEK